MKVKKSISFKLFIILTLFLWTLHSTVQEVNAESKSVLIAGEIIAIGEVRMRVAEDQWIDINSTAMPIFYESRITTSDGQATINLTNNGLIELSKKTDIYIQKEGRFVSINIRRGGLSFLFPPQSNILINTPSALVGDKEYHKIALGNSAPLLEERGQSGEILIEDNDSTTISDLKGNLKVTPLGNKKAIILGQGELIRVAQIEDSATSTLTPPMVAPNEGMFWGWVPARGAWEEITLGVTTTKPPTIAIPNGFAWGWDTNQNTWSWIKLKDGNIVVMMERFQDKLGNWYWREVTKPLPSGIKIVNNVAVSASSIITPEHIISIKEIAVVGTVAGAAILLATEDNGDTASPSN
ncbi:MAG: hypothetical protein ACE5IH_03310 [Thermodesulfobacteriota bacterium]